MKDHQQPLLLVAAILTGIIANQLLPTPPEIAVDAAIYALLATVFASIPLNKLRESAKDYKYLSVAWSANFLLIPIIALAIALLVSEPTSMLFLGLLIYFVAPCTDWVIGFTKLARGDVQRNTILLPINLLTQLLLVATILILFTNQTINLSYNEFLNTLFYWILLPFIATQTLVQLSRLQNTQTPTTIQHTANNAIIYVTALLVFIIFYANTNTLIENYALLPRILASILLFFIATYYATKALAKTTKLPRKQEIGLAITTAARNAPLMLGLTLALIPQATTVHLVLIIGMLIEFPHLIALTHILQQPK